MTWKDDPVLPSSGNLAAAMRKQDSAGLAPARITFDQGNVDTALKSAAKVVQVGVANSQGGRAANYRTDKGSSPF